MAARGPLAGSEAAFSADDHAEFAFRIDVVRDLGRRQHDLAARLKHARGRLHETAGFLRLHGLDILGVR